MIGRIIIGLIVVVAGYFLTAKASWLMDNFGRIAFFEHHLGFDGGTRLFYKLLGVLCIIIGFMLATGMLQGIVGKLFRPYFNL